MVILMAVVAIGIVAISATAGSAPHNDNIDTEPDSRDLAEKKYNAGHFLDRESIYNESEDVYFVTTDDGEIERVPHTVNNSTTTSGPE